MRILFILLQIFSISTLVAGQELNRIPLTKEDSSHGVIMKFIHEEKDSYGVISLELNANHTYLYQLSSFAQAYYSEGKWKLSNNILTLKSTLQKDNIPVKISYNGSGDFADSSNIAVVQNIKGEPLTDAFVIVNSDSIRCLPLMGLCDSKFDKIKRVKVLFENGMYSKWLPVKNGANKISLIVQTDKPIAKYQVMNNVQYKFEDKYLKWIQ